MAGSGYLLRQRSDMLLGRDTPHRRGLHLKQMFEAMGGTGIKIGQQLAVRVDFLPYETCQVLAALMDASDPLPLQTALDAIETVTQRPWQEDLAEVTPDPIGAASIACVWHARRHDGTEVAIKVQRPGVDALFAADMQVMDWLTRMLEWSTAVRPDFFANLRRDVRTMFEAELDFEAEAHFQVFFRQRVRRDKLRWVDAPEVHHALSGPRVLTTTFVHGHSCLALLEGLEKGDAAYLDQLIRERIDPRKLARRVTELSNWMRGESFFFHSDPHPGNFIIQPDSTLILLDFGACGFSSAASGDLEFELARGALTGDLDHMAVAAMATMAPMPAIDLQTFREVVRSVFLDRQLDVSAKDAHWWEKTTTSLWVRFVEITRDFGVPVSADSLRLLRASLLYDTLAMRLHPELSLEYETKRYLRRAAKRAKRRARLAKKRDRVNPVAKRIIALHDTIEAADRSIFWGSQAAEALPVDVVATVRPSTFVVAGLLRALFVISMLGALAVLFFAATAHEELPVSTVLDWLWHQATQPVPVLVLLLMTWMSALALLPRLDEKDS
jgi:ubiquinone biosynthesis protein